MANENQLSSDLKNNALLLNSIFASLSRIITQLQVPKSTVQSIIAQFLITGSTASLPRSGLPTKISETTKKKVFREVSRNPRLTRNDMQNLVREFGVEVTTSTFTNMIRSSGLKACCPCRTRFKARLRYARDHVDKPFTRWKSFLWSDETKNELFGQIINSFQRSTCVLR